MDKVTQQNAANAEESASASEELSAQAEGLQSMVGEFTLVHNSRYSSGVAHNSAAAKHHGLGKSDHVFHHVANSSAKKAKAPMAHAAVAAKKTIPLDGETGSTDDFSEFNS